MSSSTDDSDRNPCKSKVSRPLMDGHPRRKPQAPGRPTYGGVMTNSDRPWEPPLAGTEAEHLVGALDRLRTTFRWKAGDLDLAGLQARIGASSLSLV